MTEKQEQVLKVYELGEEIGYGNMMEIAHEIWARILEHAGISRKAAFCAVGYRAIKFENLDEALRDVVYYRMVDDAIENGIISFYDDLEFSGNNNSKKDLISRVNLQS